MKLIVKRVLFGIWIVVTAVTVAVIPLGLAWLLSGCEICISAQWKVIFTLLIPFAVAFLAWLVVRRRKAKEFLSYAPILTSVMREYAVLSIDRVSTVRKVKDGAANVDGLYFYGTDTVTEEVAVEAVRVLAPLQKYVEEAARLPDYSENDASLSIEQVKNVPIWVIKIRMNDVHWKLFYAPEGRTAALLNAMFFPPRQIAPQWFI